MMNSFTKQAITFMYLLRFRFSKQHMCVYKDIKHSAHVANKLQPSNNDTRPQFSPPMA